MQPCDHDSHPSRFPSSASNPNRILSPLRGGRRTAGSCSFVDLCRASCSSTLDFWVKLHSSSSSRLRLVLQPDRTRPDKSLSVEYIHIPRSDHLDGSLTRSHITNKYVFHTSQTARAQNIPYAPIATSNKLRLTCLSQKSRPTTHTYLLTLEPSDDETTNPNARSTVRFGFWIPEDVS